MPLLACPMVRWWPEPLGSPTTLLRVPAHYQNASRKFHVSAVHHCGFSSSSLFNVRLCPVIDSYNYSSESLILITAIDLTQMILSILIS